MKIYILKLLVIAFFSSVSVTSCSSEQTSELNEQIVENSYYCPMNCEEDKTYIEEGACPECGMNLVEVE